jgi:hypothetical protein
VTTRGGHPLLCTGGARRGEASLGWFRTMEVKEREDVEASSLLVSPSISDYLDSVARRRPRRSRRRGSATPVPPALVPPPRRAAAGSGYHERSGRGRGWRRPHAPAGSSTKRGGDGEPDLRDKSRLLDLPEAAAAARAHTMSSAEVAGSLFVASWRMRRKRWSWSRVGRPPPQWGQG